MPELLTDAQKVMRNDTGQRIAVALEALASEVDPSTVIAPEYDETQTYDVGDLVMRRSVLYRCTTPIPTPEEWTAAHWTAVTVADELADKYVKPTGGIPKNDLAAGVQESLGKADTALQEHQSLAAYRTAADQDTIDANLMALGLSGASVGDLVRVAAVDANGKPTSWNHVPLCDIVTNENLLYNWYFVNPVNQRGLSIYNISNSRKISIDRWYGYDGGQAGKIEVTSGGVSITKSSGGDGIYFSQKLEQDLTGETATFTVLTSTGTLFTGSAVIANDVAFISAWPNIRGSALIENGRTVIQIYVYAASLTIKAVKLELGTEQTLAHQENGQWVLNEIPDYGQELAKCRRYYSVIKNSSAGIAVVLGNVIPYSDDSVLSMDIDLAGVPTVRVTGLKLSDGTYGSGIAATYTTGYTSGRLDFFINSPGVTPGKAYRVLAQAGTSVEIEVS